jgi:hypothetical protein
MKSGLGFGSAPLGMNNSYSASAERIWPNQNMAFLDANSLGATCVDPRADS